MNWEVAAPDKESYVVKTGDTLYGIAWRYALDYRELASWNGLGNGSFIRVGQVIRLTAPSASTKTGNSPSAATKTATTASPAATTGRPIPPKKSNPVVAIAPPKWRWPVAGSIVAEFGSDTGPRTGALFAGKLSEPIAAAAAGKVVYAGSGLIGYGKLIIIKHNESFLSAYGHNAELLVKEGDQIARGQRIAQMGEGPGRKPRLHFEIRQNGKPVNPRQYLPAR